MRKFLLITIFVAVACVASGNVPQDRDFLPSGTPGVDISSRGGGGLESIYLTGHLSAVGTVQDYFGNIIGAINSGVVTWNPARFSGYGPVPGYQCPALSLNVTLEQALGWRGKRVDETGLIYDGKRYYEPVAGHFIGADPMGHGGSMDLYSFCGADPINHFDPDGRLGKQWTDRAVAYEGNINSLGDFVAAVGYGVGGTALRIPGAIGSVFDQASQGMADAHQEINQYEGGQAFLARILSLSADIAFGTTKLINDPVDTVPQIPGGLVNLVDKTLTDPKQFVNTPTVNNAFNVVDDAVAWYMIGKGVQNLMAPETVAGNVTVARWGSTGLQPGDWVMTGSANRWNYALSGKYQPASWPGNNIPAPFSSGQTFTVPESALQTPPGFFGPLKGSLGQRIYQP